MSCGCGGKKFSSPSSSAARTGVTVTSQATGGASPNARVVPAQGVMLGKAPVIQPMQRKQV